MQALLGCTRALGCIPEFDRLETVAQAAEGSHGIRDGGAANGLGQVVGQRIVNPGDGPGAALEGAGKDAVARGAGHGRAIVQAAVDLCTRRHPGDITLGAQKYLLRFYEGFGFARDGEDYLEDGIEMQTSTGGGIFSGLKRMVTGESFFITSFLHTGSGKETATPPSDPPPMPLSR